jgi:hypothetical protein
VFLLRRRDIAFRWVFGAFALFILACGTTHLFDILVLWQPDYWAQGVLKVVTAGISVVTALCLWPLLPQAVALPSPSELREANARLTEQMDERDAAMRALRRETEDTLPVASRTTSTTC